ncbi:MAG: hypothetical protein ACTSPM_06715 [Candidatus Heimdallarchaeota archaeon]
MQKISKRIATILENGGFSILYCDQVEGFLSERWEIKFSGENERYKVQIFEAGIKHPGNIQLDYINPLLETLFLLLQIGLKTDFTILKNGSSNGQDIYFKIQDKTEFFDIYIDPK